MSVLVDSSVLIDWARDRPSLQVERLNQLRYRTPLLIGDLMLAEVLQGARSEGDAGTLATLLSPLRRVDIAGERVATAAARNYRTLRSRGITTRKTIDTLIATRCILDDLPLLFSDRDFEPFVEHLGLRDAMAEAV